MNAPPANAQEEMNYDQVQRVKM